MIENAPVPFGSEQLAVIGLALPLEDAAGVLPAAEAELVCDHGEAVLRWMLTANAREVTGARAAQLGEDAQACRCPTSSPAATPL